MEGFAEAGWLTGYKQAGLYRFHLQPASFNQLPRRYCRIGSGPVSRVNLGTATAVDTGS